ncbi:hypothetical protein FOL47_004731 [Perkinsus chesapeaki]|uniref:Uncharacterized protein n=1 Tax=Perkinsus chesapeaki TaxID=330153 RepID=A0A7J6M161_PERCH|nr:hypothetical protein FOL47_004731 [Perkinsus chesapeaki]
MSHASLYEPCCAATLYEDDMNTCRSGGPPMTAYLGGRNDYICSTARMSDKRREPLTLVEHKRGLSQDSTAHRRRSDGANRVTPRSGAGTPRRSTKPLVDKLDLDSADRKGEGWYMEPRRSIKESNHIHRQTISPRNRTTQHLGESDGSSSASFHGSEDRPSTAEGRSIRGSAYTPASSLLGSGHCYRRSRSPLRRPQAPPSLGRSVEFRKDTSEEEQRRGSEPELPKLSAERSQRPPTRETVAKVDEDAPCLPARSRSLSAPRQGQYRPSTSITPTDLLRASRSLLLPYSPSTPQTSVAKRPQVYANSAPHSYFRSLPGLDSLPIARALPFGSYTWGRGASMSMRGGVV